MTDRYTRKRTPYICANDGRTLQSQQKQADINQLLRHYKKTGQITHISRSVPTYGDFSNTTDFLSAMLLIKKAESLFMELPSELRSRFENEPAQFLDFCDNPENAEELVELGLVEGSEEPPAQADPPSPDPTPEAESPVQGGE